MLYKVVKNKNFQNLILRGSGSAGKLLLSLFIGFFLGEETLGIYGLVNSTMILSLYLIGFEFYNYSTREIIEKKNVSKSIYNQTIFEFCIFLIYILISYPIIIQFIPNDFIIILNLLVFTELIGQEVYRFLIALKKSVVGNFIFAIRTGLWIFPIIILVYFEIIVNLKTIFIIWISFNIIGFIIGFVYLIKNKIINRKYFHFDKYWIKKGIHTSFPFFIATLMGVAQLHINRYFLDYFGSKEDVGVLTFFSSFSVIVNVLVYTLVIIEYYPQLIEKVKKSEFQNLKSRFRKKILNVSIVGTVIPLLVIPFLFIETKTLLIQNIPLFLLLLIGAFFSNLSNYPHYILYAYKKDKIILIASTIAFAINIFLNWLLIQKYLLLGAGIAFLISQLSRFLLKHFFTFKYENSLYRK